MDLGALSVKELIELKNKLIPLELQKREEEECKRERDAMKENFFKIFPDFEKDAKLYCILEMGIRQLIFIFIFKKILYRVQLECNYVFNDKSFFTLKIEPNGEYGFQEICSITFSDSDHLETVKTGVPAHLYELSFIKKMLSDPKECFLKK